MHETYPPQFAHPAADPVPPLPLSLASGIPAIAADDKIGAVLAEYRAPRHTGDRRGPLADDLRRTDRLAEQAHADAVGPMEGPTDGEGPALPASGILATLDASGRPGAALAAFVAGDPFVWYALRRATARGIRRHVIRTDGSGNATVDRWEPIEADGSEVGEALSAAYDVAVRRAWRQGAPATSGLLVGYLRTIARRAAEGPRPRVSARRAAAHEFIARQHERSAADVAADREELIRALKEAQSVTEARGKAGAAGRMAAMRARRRLADVAAGIEESVTL